MAQIEQYAFYPHNESLEQTEELRLLLDELQSTKAELRRLESRCLQLDQDAQAARRDRDTLLEQLRYWQQQASIWRTSQHKSEQLLQGMVQQLKMVAQERDYYLLEWEPKATQAAATKAMEFHHPQPPRGRINKHPRKSWVSVLRTFFS